MVEIISSVTWTNDQAKCILIGQVMKMIGHYAEVLSSFDVMFELATDLTLQFRNDSRKIQPRNSKALAI